METFIDPERFRSICYRAANWIYLGRPPGGERTIRLSGPIACAKRGGFTWCAHTFAADWAAQAMAKSTAPEIVSLSSSQVEELLAELAPLLPAETYGLLEKVLRTLQWLMGAIEAKNTTLGRLARMLFGAKTEKTRQLFPQPAPTGTQGATAAAPPPKRKGHGRRAAADYPGAKRVKVPHPQLHPGDPCPDCQQGKLYWLKRPVQLVRITAQPLFAAIRFELEKLRCQRCGKTFTAPPPAAAGLEKYDPNVGPMLGYLRFGGGLPPYRLERIQRDLNVCLPASTLWELMAKVGPALFTLAARGHLIHNKC